MPGLQEPLLEPFESIALTIRFTENPTAVDTPTDRTPRIPSRIFGGRAPQASRRARLVVFRKGRRNYWMAWPREEWSSGQ
jgi:hypothetical protein